ncbi:MAG: hypothetical protein CVU89_08440 [Firmicutes bacterium HGW-Firmicutes-14]|nr:MAG: hypothetical protein CVU89_08440 [Firmicutes bacterium HGW-Firmicutes-14]
MFDAMLSGLIQVFSWPALGYLFIGVIIGLIVGILPGLGGATTMALMLPFVFSIDDPVAALALLMGMHSVVTTAGDITSVLFGIPGESTTAALLLDGYPMTKKGQAGRALGAVLASSLLGGIFGAVVLVVAIPIMKPLVTLIGAPELLMLVLLGLSFIASLGGTSPLLKGLIMAGFGLLLSMVGSDPQFGINRYTFGQLFLMDGLRIIPITLGLFGIPELLDLILSGTGISRSDEVEGTVTDFMSGVKDTIVRWWLVLKSSAIGIFLGFIPGIGGSVSQWMVYAHAVQSSPEKENAGKGIIEGVIGPAAADNSKEAGGLMPTLAFGVPGTVTMAILLGAMLIIGIVPGPDMLTKNLDITFSLVWVLVVANALAVLLLLLIVKKLAKLTLLKGSMLVPVLFLLLFVGSFAETNSLGDTIVMLVFGIVGVAMIKFDWPRPPLILGVVLGELAERYLYISVGLSGTAWLLRPSVIIIGIMVIVSLAYSVLAGRKRKQGSKAKTEMAGIGGIIFSFLLILILAFAVWHAGQWRFGARLFPWVIGIPTLIFAVIQIIPLVYRLIKKQNLQIEGSLPDAVHPETGLSGIPEPEKPEDEVRITLITMGWVVAYTVAIWALGFPFGIPLVTLLYLKYYFRENWAVSWIYSLVTLLFLWGAFGQLLHIPFPKGEMISWFI